MFLNNKSDCFRSTIQYRFLGIYLGSFTPELRRAKLAALKLRRLKAQKQTAHPGGLTLRAKGGVYTA
jgi:hypothetical protein